MVAFGVTGVVDDLGVSFPNSFADYFEDSYLNFRIEELLSFFSKVWIGVGAVARF